MDLHKEWQQLNKKLFSNQSFKKEEIMSAITSESNSAIEKIKKGLQIKSYWCLLFIVGFFGSMFIFRATKEIVIAIGVVNAMYIFGYFSIRSQVAKMNEVLAENGSILEALKRNKELINTTIKGERNFSVLFTQVVVFCSLVSGRLSTGAMNFSELIQDSQFLISLLVACILAVPFAYFLGEYLNKKAFQPYLDKLNSNINKLEGVEFLKTIS